MSLKASKRALENMSLKASKSALEKYPPLIVAEQLVPNATVVEFNPKRTDINAYQRAKFQEGYEQAIKDIREWVENYAYNVAASFNHEIEDADEDADYCTGKYTTCVDLLEMIDKS